MLSEATKTEITVGMAKWCIGPVREKVLQDIPAFVRQLSTPQEFDKTHPGGKMFQEDIAANQKEAEQLIAGVLGLA